MSLRTIYVSSITIGAAVGLAWFMFIKALFIGLALKYAGLYVFLYVDTTLSGTTMIVKNTMYGALFGLGFALLWHFFSTRGNKYIAIYPAA